MSSPVVISSTSRRNWLECGRLALWLESPGNEKPDRLAFRLGRFRHVVRFACFQRRLWPPTEGEMRQVCEDVWRADFNDLEEDDFREQREKMAAFATVAAFWPPLDAVLCAETIGIPAEYTVDHRGEPGFQVTIGHLADGTEVVLRGRFDLVYLAGTRVRVQDPKGASGDYTYQAEPYALAAATLWPGFPGYDYDAVYITGGLREAPYTFDLQDIEDARAKLLAEASRKLAAIRAGEAEPTACAECVTCPIRHDCPEFQAALTPLTPADAAPMPRWPTDMRPLSDLQLLDVYRRFEAPEKVVNAYGDEIDAELKERLLTREDPTIIGPDGIGVRLAREGNGAECSDIQRALDWADKYELPYDIFAIRVEEARKALRKITDQRRYEDAVQELDALLVPRKPRLVLRPAKAPKIQKEAA